MNAQRWQEVQTTFDAIVEMNDFDRQGHLTLLSNSDPELHAVVELLLAADSDADSRLASLDSVFFPKTGLISDPLGVTGQTIAHFENLEPIGAGGMGVVYRAQDTHLGRAVALKFLLPSHALDASVKARFLREARVVAALDHPNLCTIHEVGTTDDGKFFLAMALYQGETLKARIAREGQMHLSELLEVTRQICEGLRCAHDAGIIHRDLKPGNVMLLPDGTAKILDFGLAKARDQSLSEPGARFGTVSYMSPEQIRGEAVDARADLWATGVVMYEMLTAHKPFGGDEDIAVAHSILHDTALPVTMERRDVSAAIEDIVLRLLQRDPAKRYATASDLLSDLARIDTTDDSVGSSLRTRLRRAQHSISPTHKRIATAFGVAGVGGFFVWSAAHRDPFTAGTQSLNGLDFARAEVEFDRAVKQKPNDPSARLWLAQAMMLDGRPASDWKESLTFASAHGSELAPTDQKRLDALTAYSSEQFPSACDRFSEVLNEERRTSPDSYATTVALADCLSEDRAVVPDPGSPSGYSFRTSFNSVESLYRLALEQNSSNPEAYAVIMPRLERVLSIDKNKFRRGIGPDKATFLSLPALAGDTIAYVPYLFTPSSRWRTRDPSALDDALARNRRQLRQLSIAWTNASPQDQDAHAFLGRILETTGEITGGQHAALDEIQVARSLARGPPGDSAFLRNVRLGTSEVRLWLRLGRFEKAATLADSLLVDLQVPDSLDERSQSELAETLSTIAALRGRLHTVLGLEQGFAADYQVRLPSGELLTVPQSLGADAIDLNAYAAFGVERDSIAAIAERITEKTKSLIAPAKASSVRDAILTRPMTLAAPFIGPGALGNIGSDRDIMIRAIRLLARNDRESAKRLSDSLIAQHAEYAPGEITMDAVYLDAWLRAAVGDSAGAASLLDNALRGLTVALPSILANPVEATCFVRATILRAELATSMRRPDVARTRATEAYQLWGRGDPVISSSLRRIAEPK